MAGASAASITCSARRSSAWSRHSSPPRPNWGEDAGPDGPLSTSSSNWPRHSRSSGSQHSQSLRLSVLESVIDDDDWEPVRGFVKTYGSDLFTVPFLGLSNMRGILARGVAAWLDHEAERRRPRQAAEAGD